MSRIHTARMTARPEGDFVVFLIGMRFNKPWLVHKWWPVSAAMPRMLAELYRQPALGFLSHELWVGRTILVLQYWRDLESLAAYARAKDAAHLPAWRRFNQAIGSDGSVGIWHETYQVRAGAHESVYVNMPAFGLGKVGPLVEAGGPLATAAGRLRQGQQDG
jgi:hypothetical protein